MLVQSSQPFCLHTKKSLLITFQHIATISAMSSVTSTIRLPQQQRITRYQQEKSVKVCFHLLCCYALLRQQLFQFYKSDCLVTSVISFLTKLQSIKHEITISPSQRFYWAEVCYNSLMLFILTDYLTGSNNLVMIKLYGSVKKL